MLNKKFIFSAITLAILSGCSDNDGVTVIDDGGGNSTSGQTSGETTGQDNNGQTSGPGNDQTTGQTTDETNTTTPDVDTRSLTTLDNSDAFFTALRNGLVRQSVDFGISGRFTDEVFFEVAASTDAGSAADGAAESSGSAGSDFGGAADSAQSFDQVATDSAPTNIDDSTGLDVTTTNVQEVGVDEQDRIKSDGEYLYIATNDHGNYFPELFPTDVATADVVSSIAIDPAGSDFCCGPVAPLVSTVRILELQNDASDAQSVSDVSVDLKGAAVDGMYLHKNNGNSNLILTGSSFGNFYSSWYDPYAFQNATSVIGKLDVTDPTASVMTDTLEIDGQIVSSRRIGDNLFLATRYYPVVEGIDPYTLSPEDYEAALENADLLSVLPKITNTNDSVSTDLVNPSECFVSNRAENNQDGYYTPDIVTLAVIDLNTMQLKDSECFLGSSETLYATPNSVYLATTQWGYTTQPIFALDDTEGVTNYVDSRLTTDIHQFSIEGSELTYSGSGAVAGHLGWNPDRMPFRMSEQGDYLRVATFSENQDGQSSPINVSVLDVSGTGDLEIASVLPNAVRPAHIGKPGEQLYASRFIGDKGYLVTFRQTDPLYVVDFSNPNDPFLAGELEIDGYSDYLQPIGEDYLLGIGRHAKPSDDGRAGALVQGIKLSLFNVADANNPTEVQSMIIGERGTYSDALNSHKAITIQSANDLHPTRVAFGINVNGKVNPTGNEDPWNYAEWNYTGLHGFDITVGDNAGIEQRGAMKVWSPSSSNNGQQFFGGQDRSVIVGDSTYYINGASVFAANWNDLGNFVGPK